MMNEPLLSLLTSFAPSLTQELRKAAKEWQAKAPPAPPIHEQIKDIIRAYESQQLVLVLGAGVSLPYHLPDWNTLLQTLLIGATSGGKPESQVIARLFIEIFRPSPLVAARYIRNHFRTGNPLAATLLPSFEETVRSALYSGVDLAPEPSPTVRELCALILAPARSPMLEAVLTYNFDDILERELDRLSGRIGIQIPFRSICAPTERPSERELPIYHVHGYLPSKGPLALSSSITLGEADYHQQYTRIYSWENTVQINKFSEAHCLFIGTSFSDPNLRRLLDIAREQHQDKGTRHYIIKRKPSVAETVALIRHTLDERPELLDEKVKAELTVDHVAADLIELETTFEETDARSFGVGVLWVSEWDEIPDLLKAIRLRDPALFKKVPADVERLPAPPPESLAAKA